MGSTADGDLETANPSSIVLTASEYRIRVFR